MPLLSWHTSHKFYGSNLQKLFYGNKLMNEESYKLHGFWWWIQNLWFAYNMIGYNLGSMVILYMVHSESFKEWFVSLHGIKFDGPIWYDGHTFLCSFDNDDNRTI